MAELTIRTSPAVAGGEEVGWSQLSATYQQFLLFDEIYSIETFRDQC